MYKLLYITLLLLVSYGYVGGQDLKTIQGIAKITSAERSISVNSFTDISKPIFIKVGRDSITVGVRGVSTKSASVFEDSSYWKDALPNVDIIREIRSNGFKETLVIKDPKVSYVIYDVNKDLEYVQVGNEIAVYGEILEGKFEEPRGWDAKNNYISVTQTYKEGAITYTWQRTDTVALTYPLYIDPTLTISSQSDIRDAEMRAGGNANVNFSTATSGYIGNYDASQKMNWVMRFDLSALTVAHRIDSARLKLTSAAAKTNDPTINVYNLKVPFVLSEVTWNKRNSSTDWTSGGASSAGNDYITTPMYQINNVPAATNTNFTYLVTDLVKAVVGQDSTVHNYGFLLMGNHNAQGHYTLIHASNSATEAYRPTLTVYYTVLSLSPPTNVSATKGTYHNKVVLTWTKSTGATNYTVFRATSAEGTYDSITTVGDVATYDDTGAPAPLTGIPFDLNVTTDRSDSIIVSFLNGTMSYESRFYKLKAKTEGIVSAFSDSSEGYRADTYHQTQIDSSRTRIGTYVNFYSGTVSSRVITPKAGRDTLYFTFRGKSTNNYYSAYSDTVLGLLRLPYPDAPVLHLPLTQDSLYTLRITVYDSKNDTTKVNYALQWANPVDSSGLYLTTDGGASSIPTFRSSFDWNLNLINLSKANQYARFRTLVKSRIEPTDTAFSVMYGARRTYMVPPDSIVYTTWGEVSATIGGYIWKVPTEDDYFYLSLLSLLHVPRRYLDSLGMLADTVGTSADSMFIHTSNRNMFSQLMPNVNNPFLMRVKNNDGVVSALTDTFVITKVFPGEGGSGGGISAAQARAIVHDTMKVARVEWKADDANVRNAIGDSLDLMTYNRMGGLDSAEIYVMTFDSTDGSTLYRKLKSLLNYIGL